MTRHRLTGAIDPDIRAAMRASNLGDLPAGLLNEITSGAVRRRVTAGSTVHLEGHTSAHLDLVINGMARVYVAAPDGRTMTIRYCRTGALIGAVSLFATRFSLPATIQAVVDSEFLILSTDPIRLIAQRDARLATALLAEVSDRALAFIEEIPVGSFATVRERLARHLLDLAAEQQDGSRLSVTVTHQQLADAVGTAREVVVRVLRDLRSEGIVDTHRAGIDIAAPDRLLDATYGPTVGATSAAGDPGH